MLSAQSSLIKHKELILRLLEAVKLPAKLAVIYARVTKQKKRRPRGTGKLTRRQNELRGQLPHHCSLPRFTKGALAPSDTPKEHPCCAGVGLGDGSHGWFQTEEVQVTLPYSQVWNY